MSRCSFCWLNTSDYFYSWWINSLHVLVYKRAFVCALHHR
nr:MAG TPA: hypothetical protein [Caudoviricetes sp.]